MPEVAAFTLLGFLLVVAFVNPLFGQHLGRYRLGRRWLRWSRRFGTW